MSILKSQLLEILIMHLKKLTLLTLARLHSTSTLTRKLPTLRIKQQLSDLYLRLLVLITKLSIINILQPLLSKLILRRST